MKKKYFFIVLLGMFMNTLAKASGCRWFEMYELGVKVSTQNLKVKYVCKSNIYWNSCEFIALEVAGLHFKLGEFVQSPLPPANIELQVAVETYEAMIWHNCDGGDPVPPYEKNGNYQFFRYEENIFENFIPDNP